MTSTVLVPRRIEEFRGTALVVGVTGLLVVWAVVQTATAGVVQPSIAIAFGIFITVGEIVRITLPGDREAAPLGAAGALAYALLTTFGGVATLQNVWQVVSLTALASFLGALPHVTAGRSPRLDEIARRILAAAFAAALFRPLYDGGLGPLARQERWVQAVVMVAIVLATGVFDAAVSALVRADRNRSPYRSTLRDELHALLGLGSAIGATGVLIALAAQVMGWWAIPVFCVPLLLTQFSFRRYAAIRATYLQTIRSLSRVTEVGGYTESGHARRVSEISVAVGRELGMSEDELLDLEYAALMHDLGQLSLSEPIPGGATVMVDAAEQRRIAELGAGVIRETGVLDRVAEIIERQADPYRRPREHADPSLPVSSRIIKAANAYDDLVGDSAEYGPRLDALERLRLGMAYDFDPRVVETLARIVRKTRVTQ
jgi:HD domain